MRGRTLILIFSLLKEPLKRLIAAALSQDEEAAKHALVDLMMAGKELAVTKARGG